MTFSFSQKLGSHSSQKFCSIAKRIIVSSVIAILSLPAIAYENGSMSYEKINKMLLIIDEHAKSPYTGLIASIKPEKESLSLSDVEMFISNNGNEIKKVAIGEDGSIDFPLLNKNVGETANLEINQPKGSLSVEFTAGVKKLNSKVISSKDIFGVLDDLENVASEVVGLPSWMIPDIDFLEFHFAEPAKITVQGNGFSKTFQSSEDNIIKLERNEKWEADGVHLQLSQIPKHVTFIR